MIEMFFYLLISLRGCVIILAFGCTGRASCIFPYNTPPKREQVGDLDVTGDLDLIGLVFE